MQMYLALAAPAFRISEGLSVVGSHSRQSQQSRADQKLGRKYFRIPCPYLAERESAIGMDAGNAGENFGFVEIKIHHCTFNYYL